MIGSKTTEYCGNVIYENGALKRILVEGGYIEGGMYYFYLTDHLGNNRVVANSNGSIVQTNHYYPFGMSFAEGTVTSSQPYKYNGKELDTDRGLNLYDYSARYMDPALGRFSTMDSKAEKYYSISPYAYCLDNPVNAIDPDGRQVIPVLPGVNPILLGTSNPIIGVGRMLGTTDKIARVLPKEEHHIIPRSLKGNRIVEAAKEGGFKMEGKENKISVDKFSKATGEGQHGKHPNYTDQIRNKLERVREDNPQMTPEQAVDVVKEIQSGAKDAIESNPNTKINNLKLEQQIAPLDNTKIPKPDESIRIKYKNPWEV